jgi:hypothetical protein
MSTRTAFLSKLVGLYCILVPLAMTLHKSESVAIVTTLLRNPPAMFVLGIITVGAGLAMVLAHNVWSQGTLAVVVTVVGWMALAKGLAFLFLPPGMEAAFYLRTLRYGHLFYLYMAISLALGVYLTYSGFARASQS